MTTYEFEGKTTEEAIQNASKELNMPIEELNIDIIEPGSAGIFGLVGIKKSKIRVTVTSEALESTTSVKPDFDSITIEDSVKPDIEPIETKPKMDPLVEAIETQPKMDPKVEPIKTKAKGVVKDAQGYIGKPTDTKTIPVPKE